MIERSSDDRRVKKIKVNQDKRKNKRRKEDLANIRSYYLVLGLSLTFFIFISVISFIWGR